MILERAALICLLASSAGAVEIRVASFNIGAHFNTEGNIDYSLNSPGTADYESVLAILGRIDADVVALEEIAPADIAGDPDSLDALAAALGYIYRYTAPASQAPPLAGPIDTTLRVAFLSRFPFLETAAVRSPEGAKELTRLFPTVVVDVPGTDRDPTFAALHLKSGTTPADRFRRAVEMTRLAGFVTDEISAAGSNYIVMGDFNLSSVGTTFAAPPAGLPAGFQLGPDLAARPSITYSLDPLYYFTSNPPVRLDPRQAGGSAATYETGSTIDLFLVSPAMAGRPIRSEIYNSFREGGSDAGLPKAGAPLAAETSAAASDHYVIFGDFELDEDFPPLALTMAEATVPEGSDIMMTVTLPSARTKAVAVHIAADDENVANIELVIPAGSRTGTAALRATRNFLADGARRMSFTASAPGVGSASASVEIADADGPYILAGPASVLIESFTDFAGNHDPAPWSATGGNWLGIDDGTSPAAGFRSYGGGSAGFRSGGGTGTMSVDYINGSAQVLTDVRIGFSAKLWHAAAGGSADKIEVSVIQNGAENHLPELTFEANSAGAGDPVVKTAAVSGLSVAPGDSFRLQISFVPGPAVVVTPADVFINEFHYDNKGADTGEFVEIVAGPAFSGSPGETSVIPYNGGDGKSYGLAHPLSSFDAGDLTAGGYRIYSKFISGIQNGDPDGFALVSGGLVKQFISYGGPFAATDGPALGMVSEDVGVRQTAADAGFGSIGLTGSGGLPGDFVWTRFDGLAHTPGHANAGQNFVLPGGWQGIAIDGVTVEVLPSSDRDGDGVPDADEHVFGTDPLDAASRCLVTVSSPVPGLMRVGFPSVAGRSYVIQSSADLTIWHTEMSVAGTGGEIQTEMPGGGTRTFYRVGVMWKP